MRAMIVLMAICGWFVADRTLEVYGAEEMKSPAGTAESRSFNVLKYGAVGDDKTDNTEALSACLKAVIEAGVARFRPIVLTSLTTFAGLTPLLLETSVQAQFLVPMATSLAFGVLFSTAITLFLVPSGYLILEDLRHLPDWLRSRKAEREGAPDWTPETTPTPES